VRVTVDDDNNGYIDIHSWNFLAISLKEFGIRKELIKTLVDEVTYKELRKLMMIK
jgi:hypothetical protein